MSVTNWLKRSSGLVVPSMGFANLAGQMQPCPDGDCCDDFSPVLCTDCMDPAAWPGTAVTFPALANGDCSSCASTAFRMGLSHEIECRDSKTVASTGWDGCVDSTTWCSGFCPDRTFGTFQVTVIDGQCVFEAALGLNVFVNGEGQVTAASIFTWKLTVTLPEPRPFDIDLPFDNQIAFGGATLACDATGTVATVDSS